MIRFVWALHQYWILLSYGAFRHHSLILLANSNAAGKLAAVLFEFVTNECNGTAWCISCNASTWCWITFASVPLASRYKPPKISWVPGTRARTKILSQPTVLCCRLPCRCVVVSNGKAPWPQLSHAEESNGILQQLSLSLKLVQIVGIRASL